MDSDRMGQKKLPSIPENVYKEVLKLYEKVYKGKRDIDGEEWTWGSAFLDICKKMDDYANKSVKLDNELKLANKKLLDAEKLRINNMEAVFESEKLRNELLKRIDDPKLDETLSKDLELKRYRRKYWNDKNNDHSGR